MLAMHRFNAAQRWHMPSRCTCHALKLRLGGAVGQHLLACGKAAQYNDDIRQGLEALTAKHIARHGNVVPCNACCSCCAAPGLTNPR